MDSTDTMEEQSIDLLQYTVQESCLWLISKLEPLSEEGNPYLLPFCSYVLTWYQSVPLECIIIAQSPYPQNVYPPIAAAMSFDSDLALVQYNRHIYQSKMPPTVEILANDLYIHTGMKKEDTVNILKNGWALVEKGILLVNERVFTKEGDSNYYYESANQCNVIIRLLQETEKYGKRVVDVYGLGTAGQRMASNLCSWYKSDTVKLSKHTATHPAALARRFENHNDPKCHLDTPSFSKSLAKILSNHVAFGYTMGKQTEADIRQKRVSDAVGNSAPAISNFAQSVEESNEIIKELYKMDKTDMSKFESKLEQLSISFEKLIARSGIASSALSNVRRVNDGYSGNVAKAAPALESPSAKSLSEHTGKQSEPSKPIKRTTGKIVLTKSSKSVAPTEASSFAHISPPASVISVASNPTPSKFKLTPRKSTNSTPIKNTNDDSNKNTDRIVPVSSSKCITESSMSNITNNTADDVSDTESNTTETKPVRVVSSMGAKIRKKQLAQSSAESKTSGLKENKPIKQVKESDGPLSITKEQRDQLSSVQAVVEANKADHEDDEECIETLASIQHDIMHMTKYNTSELIDAIEEDTRNISNFNFIDWAIDNSKPSITYSKCKEIFNF